MKQGGGCTVSRFLNRWLAPATGRVMKVAIYDLDKTLVRRATFTPFLVFAARRLAPVRLIFTPVWILLMIGYKFGFYSRTRLKIMGMRLMLGTQDLADLRETGRQFADAHVERAGWLDGVTSRLREDQSAGARVAIATAAFEFYAQAFAERLGVDTIIATRWDGKSIPGGNCYGDAKRRRVEEWLGTPASDTKMRFVSDSFADQPLLDLAADPVFVTTSAAKRDRALAKGWRVIDGET